MFATTFSTLHNKAKKENVNDKGVWSIDKG